MPAKLCRHYSVWLVLLLVLVVSLRVIGYLVSLRDYCYKTYNTGLSCLGHSSRQARTGVCGRPCLLGVRSKYTVGYLLGVAFGYVRTLYRWLCVHVAYGRVSFTSAPLAGLALNGNAKVATKCSAMWSVLLCVFVCVVGRLRRVITPRVVATYPHSRPLFSVAVHDVEND